MWANEFDVTDGPSNNQRCVWIILTVGATPSTTIRDGVMHNQIWSLKEEGRKLEKEVFNPVCIFYIPLKCERRIGWKNTHTYFLRERADWCYYRVSSLFIWFNFSLGTESLPSFVKEERLPVSFCLLYENIWWWWWCRTGFSSFSVCRVALISRILTAYGKNTHNNRRNKIKRRSRF